MRRRKFLAAPAAAVAAAGSLSAAPPPSQAPPRRTAFPAGVTPSAFRNPSSQYSPFATPDYYSYADDLKVEWFAKGKPHRGKVLAAVQAHSDDIPLYAGGLVAKLIDEGYTAYLIRISNDESAGSTLGHGVVQNEIDNQAVAKALGCARAYSFYYRNHRMDDCAEIELRARLIFLFRLLRVDTLVTMDPYNHYEENPDHVRAARAAEAACWMAAGPKDYPEHYRMDLKPCWVREKYYHARSPNGHNLVNRIVDISDYIDIKVNGNVANKGKGPAGLAGSRLRAELTASGRRLELLGNNDDDANFNYVKHFLMDDWRLLGRRFGMQYAEAFRYIEAPPDYRDNIRQYVNQHATTV